MRSALGSLAALAVCLGLLLCLAPGVQLSLPRGGDQRPPACGDPQARRTCAHSQAHPYAHPLPGAERT